MMLSNKSSSNFFTCKRSPCHSGSLFFTSASTSALQNSEIVLLDFPEFVKTFKMVNLVFSAVFMSRGARLPCGTTAGR